LRNILNNFKNALIKKSLNKLIYEKIVCDVLSLIDSYKKNINYVAKKEKNQREVAKFITFVNIKIKLRYNNRYQSLILRKNNKIFFKLYFEYKISNLKNSKFSN
jgi:hypothetical protein